MKSPHILLLNKNVAELRRELAHILGKKSASAFDANVKLNVAQLFSLGLEHLTFAGTLGPTNWRQIVSRTYYAAYSVSKSVRLAVNGHYSREVRDHDKVGELPVDFPDKSTYANRLRLLRDDRNLCDYDHTVQEIDLGMNSTDALALVRTLVDHARGYLRKRKYRV
jgi:hypothetical protein